MCPTGILEFINSSKIGKSEGKLLKDYRIASQPHFKKAQTPRG